MKSNSKKKTFLSRLVILFFVLVVGAWVAWLWWNDSIAAVDPKDTIPVIFVVERGDGVKAIAANLYQKNLIRSSTGFYLLVKLLGIETDLQAGDFRLSRSMDAKSIATELTHGILDIWVTTLEGWRSEEVASKLSKDLDVPEQEILKYAVEGRMFPDTYLIPRDATPTAIVQLFTDNFEKKFTDQMREDIKKSGLTMNQVITLASIVEREGKTDQDRPVIAGILIKRLKNDWPLQVDATLQYALGYQVTEKSWWKKYLTDADKKIQSPYNTYARPGLPPGPIGNPGLAAIKAVIYPTETEYWYYLHDEAGGVHYGKTLDEHNENIANFLQ